ncbi:hypothetical protein PLICRDRAFT_88440 [Plicaturopsis crispa FD-325 SS-3]|nr:hypothetical protein PLICRDRAFT_88440 [Plicaturopsis crispa FD-325 SS-3]
MVRRVASQVHRQMARLMRVGYVEREPVWYQAVIDNPPLPLPARRPPARTEYDTPSYAQKDSPSKLREPRPLPVAYVEDDLRRQFFRDHPFETFRPAVLVEGATVEDEHPIRGPKWLRLRQRGRNPKPEDAIRFALNLYEHQKDVSLSVAYKIAVAQFRALRSEHHIASITAAMEAEMYSAEFGPTVTEEMYQAERKALEAWKTKEEMDEGAIAARKKWKAIIERQGGVSGWTKGEEYVRLWREGVRPTYAPALTTPVAITSAGLEGTQPETEFISIQA